MLKSLNTKVPGEHWQGMVNKTYAPYCDLWQSGKVALFVCTLPEKWHVAPQWCYQVVSEDYHFSKSSVERQTSIFSLNYSVNQKPLFSIIHSTPAFVRICARRDKLME